MNDVSRAHSWNEWLSDKKNGLDNHRFMILPLMEGIAEANSEDALTKALQALEECEVFQQSDNLQNWFHLKWLTQAKVTILIISYLKFLLLSYRSNLSNLCEMGVRGQ